jgi:hypothetical protein
MKTNASYAQSRESEELRPGLPNTCRTSLVPCIRCIPWFSFLLSKFPQISPIFLPSKPVSRKNTLSLHKNTLNPGLRGRQTSPSCPWVSFVVRVRPNQRLSDNYQIISRNVNAKNPPKLLICQDLENFPFTCSKIYFQIAFRITASPMTIEIHLTSDHLDRRKPRGTGSVVGLRTSHFAPSHLRTFAPSHLRMSDFGPGRLHREVKAL